MATSFQIISEDFYADLDAISDLMSIVVAGGGSPKSRLASVNSATLLMASTFEEFVREVCRQYAREIVSRAASVTDLPVKLTATAWRRTLEDLARAKIDTGGTQLPMTSIAADARAALENMSKFLDGDLTQDVFGKIAHNENNMRPNQINALFKVCDISGACDKISDTETMKAYFEEDNPGKVSNMFSVKLNDFMEKRNSIAHNLNPGSSDSQEQVLRDIAMFKAFAGGVVEFIERH